MRPLHNTYVYNGETQIMMKWLLLPLLILTSLQAEDIDPDKFSEIYIQGILFVALFTVMSIISFIVSKRHAKQHVQKHTDDIAQKKALAAEQERQKEDRLTELSKLVDDGLLREEEFQILRKNIQN